MDRLKINTKAFLGMATRTVDQEHERHHSCVKSLNHAVGHYETAMSKFSAALVTLSNTMETVEKAYKEVLVNEKEVTICIGFKETIERIERIRLSALEHFIETLKTTVTPVLSPLKTDSEVCDKIHNERAKAVDLYDYNRDVVEKKEVQYASKGKPLDDSKRYKEELSKLEASKEDYLSKHNEYNNAYDQLLSRKSEQTLLSLKIFAHCCFDFSKILAEETEKMCDAIDKIDIQGNREDGSGPISSEDDPRNVNAERAESKESEEIIENDNSPSDLEGTTEDVPKGKECGDSNVEYGLKETPRDLNTD